VNTQALKHAEQAFLKKYPEGFKHPELAALGKKHKMDQHEAFARERFAKGCFEDPVGIVEDMARLVSRSSMVSMFEKPKFKTMVSTLRTKEAVSVAESLYELLHGRQKAGFEALVAELGRRKLAKWTLVTVFPAYYRPRKEVFVKPTTAKLIIEQLDLDLTYDASPTWPFHRDFRKAINAMRSQVSTTLSPNNPAFCGFLMMELGN